MDAGLVTKAENQLVGQSVSGGKGKASLIATYSSSYYWDCEYLLICGFIYLFLWINLQLYL